MPIARSWIGPQELVYPTMATMHINTNKHHSNPSAVVEMPTSQPDRKCAQESGQHNGRRKQTLRAQVASNHHCVTGVVAARSGGTCARA